MWRVSLSLKHGIDKALRCLGLFGLYGLWMAIAALCIPSVRPHFVSLLYRSLVSFTHFKNTTPWAFISFDLVQPVLLLVFFVVLLHQSHGGDAVKIHWRKEGIIGLKALGLLVVFYYMPIFLVKGVLEVYSDHQSLVERNQALRTVNQRQEQDSKQAQAPLQSKIDDLNKQLDFRKHNLVSGDPVTTNVLFVFQAFSKLRSDLGKDAKCYLKVTSPPDSLELARGFAELARVTSRCQVDGPSEFNGDSELEKSAMAGSTDRRVTIYAAKDSAVWPSMEFLNMTFPLQRRYDPKDTRENFVWFQFGKGSHWSN